MQTEQIMYNEATFKLIMIGQSGTGKSCLLVRFLKDYFDQHYSVTVGVEFATKLLRIDQNYGVKLQIWDTAGQQNFRALIRSFYRNSSAVALVYDITKQSTFLALKDWIVQAREHAPQNTMYILIGTHLDMQQYRQVSVRDAEQWIKVQGIILFFETSSKTAENVNKAFEELGKQLFINYMKDKKNKCISSDQNTQRIEQHIRLSKQGTGKDEEKGFCC